MPQGVCAVLSEIKLVSLHLRGADRRALLRALRCRRVHEFAASTVNEAEVVEFARRFDPQAMHVRSDPARDGHFGGLIASGWHTASLMMRVYVEHYLSHVASVASPASTSCVARAVRPVTPCICGHHRGGGSLALQTRSSMVARRSRW